MALPVSDHITIEVDWLAWELGCASRPEGSRGAEGGVGSATSPRGYSSSFLRAIQASVPKQLVSSWAGKPGSLHRQRLRQHAACFGSLVVQPYHLAIRFRLYDHRLNPTCSISPTAPLLDCGSEMVAARVSAHSEGKAWLSSLSCLLADEYHASLPAAACPLQSALSCSQTFSCNCMDPWAWSGRQQVRICLSGPCIPVEHCSCPRF